MKLPLIITPDAEADLSQAKKWYEKKRAGLGKQFVLYFEAAVKTIVRAPRGASEVFPGVRRKMMRKFPYGVFYRVDPHQIAVIAVYHSSRDPRGWKSRI